MSLPHCFRTPILFGLLALLALGLTGCRKTPDEAQIRQHIEEAFSAASAADASALGAVLTEDFAGNNGTMNKEALLNMLRMERLSRQVVRVFSGPVAIEEQGGRYLANFTVTLTSGGSVMPQHMGTYKVQTAWRQDGGTWRCYWAAWDR